MSAGSGSRSLSLALLARLRRRWVLPAAALLVVLLVGGGVFVLGRHEQSRDPVEFVPASAEVALGLDTRVGGPTALRLAKTWSASDVRRLSERTTEAAQKLIDWTGLDLNIEKDVRPWYGGEAVVTMLAGSDRGEVNPGSVVLVVRTTSTRRARASMEKAVHKFAQEAEWKRRSVSYHGATFASWRDATGVEQFAYAVKDGCLVVGRHAALVGDCVEAAEQPSKRLASTESFRTTALEMDKEGGVWGYFHVNAAAHAARLLLPLATGRGWMEVARRSLHGLDLGDAAEEDWGAVAVGLMPEPDGARLRGVYRKAGATRTTRAPSRVATFLPREAAAYALFQDMRDHWFTALTPNPADLMTSASGGANPLTTIAGMVAEKLAPPPTTWFGFTKAPSELAVIVLPRGREQKPALAVVAPKEEIATPPQGLLAVLSKNTTSAIVGDLEIVGTDAKAVQQCEAAAKSARARLALPVEAATRFEVWVKPAALEEQFDQVKEIRVRGWDTEGGGEGELSITVPPRYLLGS